MLQGIIDFYNSNKDFLAPILTGFFTLMLFVVKEFWETRRAKRKERQEKLDVFGQYGYPLLNATKDLVDRLFDILLDKPRYLHKDAPQTEYYKYHYISTLYRMCSVLGWIQAIRREILKMEVGNTAMNQDLEKAIKDFQTALASNFFMKGQQIDYLIARWGLNHGTDEKELTIEEKNNLEREFEILVVSYMEGQELLSPLELGKEQKIELLQKVRGKIAEALDCTHEMQEDLLTQYISSCLRVVSRRVSWIYLDWQKGIGDFMLIEQPPETNGRKLEIKSFQAFEDAFQDFKEGKGNYRWIERVDRLFHDLQPGSSILYDMRDQQLEEVSAKLVSLITSLRNAGIGTDKIKLEDLERLEAKKEKLEARKQEEAEKMKAS